MKEWLGKGNRWNPDKSSNAASLAEYAHNSMAIGWGARVNATQSIAMGIGATIFSQTTNALALGTASVVNSNADRGIAVGFNAQSRAHDALAIGSNSLVSNNAISAIAIGQSAKAAGEQSIALGKGASVDHKNSIAMRAGATTTRDNEVSIGSDSDTAYLSNITRGVLDTDAVNVSQLKEVQAKGDVGLEGIAEAFGGGAEYDKETGQLKAPNYKDALTADKNLNSVEAGFKYVGGQLTDQGKKITNIDGRVTKNEGDITSINKNINSIEDKVSAGTLGLVQLSKSEVTTEDGDSQEVTALVIDNVAAKEADVFNISNGKEGRTLTGVKAGQIAQDSLDAINGSQLHVANQNVAKVLGGNATFKDGQLTGVDFSGAFTGLAEGEKIESVYGGFDNLDKRVDATSKVVDEINSGLGIGEDGESGSVGDVIGSIKDDVSSVVAGRAGLIKLNDDGTQIIVDNKLAQEADVFNIAKADEKGRTLTGVKAGQIAQDSLDAINGSQLHVANQNVAKVLGGNATFKDGQLTGVDFSGAFTGLAEGEKIESVYGGFENLDKRVDATSKVVDDINSGLGIGEDGESGSVGEVIGGIKDDVSKVVAGKAGLIQLNDGSTKLIIDNELAENALTFDISNGEEGRTLTGLADGTIATGSKDAVTGGQLFTVGTGVATALGGGAKLDEDGQLTGVNFQEALGTKDELINVYDAFENVGDTLSDHDFRLTENTTNIKSIINGKSGLVQLAEDGKSLVIDNKLAGGADTFDFSIRADEEDEAINRLLTGIAEGEISQNSVEAINGSQLHMANLNVANALGGKAELNEDGQLTRVNFQDALGAKDELTNVYAAFENVGGTLSKHDERITNNMNSINNIMGGEVGLIKLSGNRIVIDNSLAGVKVATIFDFSNGIDSRTLTGVANGKVSPDSLDAVNGSQLFATNQKFENITNINGKNLDGITDAMGGDAKVENGLLTGVDFGGALKAEKPITSVNEGFEYVTGRLDGQDKKLENHENRITNIEGNISNIADGKAGLIQVSEDGNSLIIDNGLAKDANTFNISNGDKDLTLTGVKDGQIVSESKDAINGSQLYASNKSIAEMFGGGATIDENGYITTPEYVIGDKTFNNVGASIEHLANSITTGEVGIFQLDREKNQIIIADNTDINSETTLNVGNRKIVGVANGKVEKGSQEVVNGGQLWETNQQVTSNTTQIKHINKTLDHYNNRISHLEKTVHENRKRASAGTASAMAMSSIPYMDYAKYSMGMGVASYDGEAAMSIGMEFKLGDNGRFRVQGSYDTQNKAGVGVGVAFSF
ncbi:YadA-like family protein [Ignatzschineria cameli]|uniref:YadA-like family protein n=1 Tax=Ignatzschineria cameli TaxID=2182793 RepID=UPI001EFD77F1|nr:YadA-like family protein [Ignatzschineria cameli]